MQIVDNATVFKLVRPAVAYFLASIAPIELKFETKLRLYLSQNSLVGDLAFVA
jgi:hypothetical protein